jgi:thiamine kinase-like enzyme
MPVKVLCLPDDIVNLQYKLTIHDNANDQTIETLINARLFPDLAECKTYLDQIVMPVAARMVKRPEIKPFARPVAIVKHLGLALAAFPIDGLIPTLVDATDTNQMARLLGETLPEALSGEFVIKEVRVLPVHYGRYKRCVLRYSVDGLQTRTQTRQTITVYGKIDPDGLGELTVPVISALRDTLNEPALPYRFRIPRSMGYIPDLQLLLMEALPGKSFFKELLKSWAWDGDGKPSTGSDVTLEESIRACAWIAATLHGSKIKLGQPSTLEMQVAELLEEVEVFCQAFPESGAQVKSWLDQTVEFAQAYPAMPLCFSHGDYRYTQLIFEGKKGGLVDFDSICQAEPAQDVGQYLAYQRLSMIRVRDPNSRLSREASEHLSALFLDAYVNASKAWIADEEVFRGRAAIYELIGLVRLALHSWEKLKVSRLKQALSLLEERIECQKQISLLARNKTP